MFFDVVLPISICEEIHQEVCFNFTWFKLLTSPTVLNTYCICETIFPFAEEGLEISSKALWTTCMNLVLEYVMRYRGVLQTFCITFPLGSGDHKRDKKKTSKISRYSLWVKLQTTGSYISDNASQMFLRPSCHIFQTQQAKLTTQVLWNLKFTPR